LLPDALDAAGLESFLCHELRIRDGNSVWRIIYRVDEDAIILVEVFKKKTRSTPKPIVDVCRSRLAKYDKDIGWLHLHLAGRARAHGASTGG
jgi:hypothetical protein